MSRDDLFSGVPSGALEKSADSARAASSPPLAARMRPESLSDFVGQRHILAEGQLLRRAIEADRIQSLILYGPPGTGKTSLARVIAAHTRSRFERLSGVESNVADMRRVLLSAANRLENSGVSTILFVDEIHRFNKSQQDILLPDVESGVIRLIGATTHNPFFFVNSPLVSRSHLFELRPLEEGELMELMRRALSDPVRGLGGHKIQADDKALEHLARVADGDAQLIHRLRPFIAIVDAGLCTLLHIHHQGQGEFGRVRPGYLRHGSIVSQKMSGSKVRVKR